jgi:ferredoxin--NADP+ reductase
MNKITGLDQLEVLSVKHWTEKTFSFSCDRPVSFRFRSGEFVMIGLIVDGKPLLRAYSIASPNWHEKFEFYSIKVDSGPLTSRLQNLCEGDTIAFRNKPVGTLVHDALLPGKRLILFSTGTGVAPFVSIIRDPETYEKFEEVLLFQTCRISKELEYGESILKNIEEDEFLKELVSNKLRFIPTTTRETSEYMGRVSDWLRTDKFSEVTGRDLNSVDDRVMICGSIAMLNDFRGICETKGLKEGSNSSPADFVIEKAFVD